MEPEKHNANINMLKSWDCHLTSPPDGSEGIPQSSVTLLHGQEGWWACLYQQSISSTDQPETNLDNSNPNNLAPMYTTLQNMPMKMIWQESDGGPQGVKTDTLTNCHPEYFLMSKAMKLQSSNYNKEVNTKLPHYINTTEMGYTFQSLSPLTGLQGQFKSTTQWFLFIKIQSSWDCQFDSLTLSGVSITNNTS